MKIIYCDKCGALFNQDVISFPDTYDHNSGELIEKNAVWNDALNRYTAKIDCPVCKYGELIKE